MKYLDKTHKQLALPSGATIEIYKLNSFNEPFVQAARKDDKTSGLALSLYILTEKVGPLLFEGESGRIVNKPVKDCTEFEIAIEVLEQADADAIIQAVLDFSGMTKAGQEARKTFPEGQEAGGVPAPAGQSLRVLADDTPKAANG